jgi:hypothetical protein
VKLFVVALGRLWRDSIRIPILGRRSPGSFASAHQCFHSRLPTAHCGVVLGRSCILDCVVETIDTVVFDKFDCYL